MGSKVGGCIDNGTHTSVSEGMAASGSGIGPRRKFRWRLSETRSVRAVSESERGPTRLWRTRTLWKKDRFDWT